MVDVYDFFADEFSLFFAHVEHGGVHDQDVLIDFATWRQGALSENELLVVSEFEDVLVFGL